jgi:hypothetical protein
MAKINVSNLHPVGFDLFSDSENYMSELSEREFDSINGGATPTTASPAAAAVAQSTGRCARVAAKGAAKVATAVGASAVAIAGYMETGE